MVEDDFFDQKLKEFVICMKQVVEVLIRFLSFLHALGHKVIICWHWCLVPIFKTCCWTANYGHLGQENVVALVIEYDDELFLTLLIEAAKLLMLFNGAKFENLFFTTTTNVNTYKDLVLRKLVGYHQYFADVDNYKCALSWWHKEQNKFPTIALAA